MKTFKCNIASVCYSYRHDFGLLDTKEQNEIRTTVESIVEAYEKEMTEPSDVVVKSVDEKKFTYSDYLLLLTKFYLTWQTIFFIGSAMIYDGSDTDKWFSRVCVSIVSAGFLGLILKKKEY